MIKNKLGAVRFVLSANFSVNKIFYRNIKMEANYPKKNTDKKLKHLFDGSDLNVYDPNVVNLGVGAPGPDILLNCCKIFEKATSHRMKIEADNQGMLFQYGPTDGPIEVRSSIAKFLTDAYKSEVKRYSLHKKLKMEVSYPKENTDKMLKHLFDGSDLNVYDQNVINLGVGAPGPDILLNCCEIFEKATSHRMKIETQNQGMLFQYGPTAGGIEVRSGVAKFLTDAHKSEVKSEDLIVTTGATQGLHIILSTLIDLNGFIFVDEVTYMIALETFKQFTTIKIIPVKLNNDGVDIEALRKILKENCFKSETKSYWGLYYAIPTYHNPTGIIFSEDVLKKLIDLAREFDILVACDDVYNTLYYGTNEAQKRFYAYDDPNDDDFMGNVISNGSFSKVIGPGIRFGWLEAPPRCKIILESSGVLKSGGCLNNYTSGIMASLFELGLAQAHAEMVKQLYQERMLATCKVLKQHLPKSCHFVEPQGGYFVWIEMPTNTDANDFLRICLEKHKLFFIPGDRFTIDGSFKNCFRISIAFQKKEILENAVRQICDGLKEYLM